MVHCIENSQGSIYEMGEDMKIYITLNQIETWVQDGVHMRDVKEVKWETNYSGLRKNSCLPGNIYSHVQIEPLSADVEQGLWWVGDKVMRDDMGRALYRTMWYDMDSKYQLYDPLPEEKAI